MHSRFRLYKIDRHPETKDLSNYRTNSCNPDFVREITFKYQLYSPYPQHYLVMLGIPLASKIVDIDGVRIHLILQWSNNIDAFELWTFPDNEENVAWFTTILSSLVDVSPK